MILSKYLMPIWKLDSVALPYPVAPIATKNPPERWIGGDHAKIVACVVWDELVVWDGLYFLGFSKIAECWDKSAQLVSAFAF